jgi:hypothetical protein
MPMRLPSQIDLTDLPTWALHFKTLMLIVNVPEILRFSTFPGSLAAPVLLDELSARAGGSASGTARAALADALQFAPMAGWRDQ